MNLIDKINEAMVNVKEHNQCDYFLECKDGKVYCGLLLPIAQMSRICKHQDNTITPLEYKKRQGYYWGCKIFNEPEGKRL